MGIQLSYGRGSPFSAPRRIKRKKYQGLHGISGSGFGYRAMPTNLLTDAARSVEFTTADGRLPARNYGAGLQIGSMIRVGLMVAGGIKIGGLFGIALAAMAVPEALVLLKSVEGRRIEIPDVNVDSIVDSVDNLLE